MPEVWTRRQKPVAGCADTYGVLTTLRRLQRPYKNVLVVARVNKARTHLVGALGARAGLSLGRYTLARWGLGMPSGARRGKEAHVVMHRSL